jgi:TRAP-type uncharacterized transport system substrate-binding protein
MRRLRDFSRRDLLLIVGPAIAIVALGLWLAAIFVKPAPPKRLVLATGPEAAGYSEFGQRYRTILARDGITLELRATEGSVENYTLLKDPASGVDAALMQSGIGSADDAPDLLSLGAVAYEPLWIFCRGRERLEDIGQLGGRRLAIGPPGSGTHRLALNMLEANGLTQESVAAVHATGLPAAEALLAGAVDCMIMIAPAEAGIVKALVFAPGLSLMHIARADAYVRRMQYLTKLVLPEGVLDLQNSLPARDVTLLGATTQLVARRELHPAIQSLLLQAASEVHAAGSLFSRPGEFPSARRSDLPLSDDAARYYASGKPFLQRYLPFWLANLVDRMLVAMIPIVAIVFPLVRVVPPLYRWRVRSRIYRWYGELMFIENETRTRLTAGEVRDYHARLDAIEHTVDQLSPPLAYADQLYLLRQHIDFVRGKLTQIRSSG